MLNRPIRNETFPHWASAGLLRGNRENCHDELGTRGDRADTTRYNENRTAFERLRAVRAIHFFAWTAEKRHISEY